MILEKWNDRLSMAMKGIMILLFFIALIEGNKIIILGVFLNIIFAFLPGYLNKNTKYSFPWTLDFMVIFSLLLHTIGFTFDLYHDIKWWWWDNMTHALGSFVFGMLSFHLVFTLNFLGKVIMTIPMVGLFIFLSTMGVGAIWEILEFYMDMILKTNTQLSLNETMSDLQFNFIGAIIISFVGMRYLYVKREKEIGKLVKPEKNGKN